MPLNAQATKLAQMIDPQVLAPMIDKKLVDAIRFMPIAEMDTTLVGQPGSELTLPAYAYIGDAADVAEGADIPIKQLSATSVKTKVKKAGVGVQITDEAVLSGYGDPVGEAINQIALSIATKCDNDIHDALKGVESNMTATLQAKISSNGVADAIALFGEDLDGTKILYIAAEQLAHLRKSEDWIKASELGVGMLVSGAVGRIWGCDVVISNKIKKVGTAYNNFIVKPGAIRLIMKRGTLVESDRDIVNKSTVITGDKHYTAYLYDKSKAVKLVTKES